ncbi:oncoprotein-induced transcript 3 protein isoform X1 [Petromyzon marinus]|uniref:oncoprotein-induced transcript 3 protein isoform X1 n=1 Tax=Petromyzon marinus TaxID=7757 RepID=UPI003F704B39
MFAAVLVFGILLTARAFDDRVLYADLDPCTSYISLSEEWRNTEFAINGSNGKPACDRDMAGEWYRFTGLAGDVMPTFCVDENHCGTHAPVWLNGTHPRLLDGVVSVPACAAFRDNCCMWQSTVDVKACSGGYYVYRLPRPPVCYHVYCGHFYEPCERDSSSCQGEDCAQPPSCRCGHGMLLAEDGNTCMDVNECEEANGGCAEVCVNLRASFRCECPVGQVLSPDGRSCLGEGQRAVGRTGGIPRHVSRELPEMRAEQMTLCETNNGGCSHLCVAAESSHHCECPRGLLLAEDNRTCQVPVRCSPDAIDVAVPKDQVRGLELFLANASCKGVSNGTHVNVHFGLKTCGTTLEVTADKIIASNVLTGIPKQGPGSNGDLIIRTSKLLIQVFCEFPRHELLSQGFLPKPGNPIPRLWGHSQGHFPFALLLYREPSFEAPVGPGEMPLAVKLHQPLYFGLAPTTRLDGLEVLVERCYATPGQNGNHLVKYFLIRDGCLVDNTIRLLPSSNLLSKHYQVQVFKFLGKENMEVFLHCEVTVCQAFDAASRCSQGCMRRVRRSAQGGGARPRLAGPRIPVITGGPIVMHSSTTT